MDEPTTPATEAAPAEAIASESPAPAIAPAAEDSQSGGAEDNRAAIPEEIVTLAQRVGVEPHDLSPARVLQFIDAERTRWEELFKEQAEKHSAQLHPLRSRLETAWNHIRGRAQNGSAPDQEFARTHAL